MIVVSLLTEVYNSNTRTQNYFIYKTDKEIYDILEFFVLNLRENKDFFLFVSCFVNLKWDFKDHASKILKNSFQRKR